MDTIRKTVYSVRSELETLSTVNAAHFHNDNSAPGGNPSRLDVSADTIFRLQNQVDRLAEKVRPKVNDADSPKKNASSDANDLEKLMIQMDEVRDDIRALADMHRHMDHISLASKISLETMFYQLTKELEGRCHPENIEFGLDEDRLFIFRQRVLERLSIEDSVQCEFLRLKASQQMFS